ncbi:OsmC family peroxiredoxin [Candidatus Thorarchaeota archaeon]|jgi:organic hydroperoxide reductase OsmC/OhrA|nr:MAG: OsmC family peroxiredoxin [Candidatus Thorarchaeota archaeon]
MRVKSRYPERLEYKASSKWDGKTGGLASTGEDRAVKYDTPKSFGGNSDGVCPDELFVASVLGCLNNTFLDFQRRFEMELKSFELHGTATAVFDGTGYKVTGLKITGSVLVGEDELETGERCVELMQEYCHITRTIKDCLPTECDVRVSEE